MAGIPTVVEFGFPLTGCANVLNRDHMSRPQSSRISGKVTSPGLVMEPALEYRDHPDELSPPRTIKHHHQIQKEPSAVERAVKIVLEDLKISAQRIEAQTGPKLDAILSIGTNDLTQFAMAAGRENPLVNECYVENHPAVLRLARIVLDEAGDVPVTVCGELASEVGTIPILLQLGLRSFSVAPPLVSATKQTLRRAI